MYPPNSFHRRHPQFTGQIPSQQAYPNPQWPRPNHMPMHPNSPGFVTMPVSYNYPQYQTIPNQRAIIHPSMPPLHPRQVIVQPMAQPSVLAQRPSAPMYKRCLSDDSSNFMCLRRNVSIKRELEDDTEEQNKVLIKEHTKQSTSFTGPSISMIIINLSSKTFNILYKLFNNNNSVNDFNAHKDDHWIFNFIIKIWDTLNWTNVTKKIINAKTLYSGKGDYFNRISIRLDPEGNCCLPYELAKPINPPMKSNKTSQESNSDIYCYNTCTISSPNFDFINSLADNDKTSTQKILIETVECNKLGHCIVCESKKPEQSKISLTLENWIDKDKYGLVIRCFSSQLRKLTEKINKLRHKGK